MPMSGNPASLYFHIPFCEKKCGYCHFYVLPNKPHLHEALLKGLKLEWKRRLYKLKDKEIVSIYFGGGTPSLFGYEAMKQLLDLIYQSNLNLVDDIEITLEVNPENGTLENFKGYSDIGINRVSLGAQSFNKELLKTLTRTHSPSKTEFAVYNAKEAGIDNITIDLMYELPGQTLSSWNHTLDIASSLPITHLSLYNLTFEPHTLFYKKREQLLPILPSSSQSEQMYTSAVEKLKSAGLNQYEISAFSKPNYESRHNIGYWTARPFLGFGPSAFSYWEGERFSNVSHLGKYLRALETDQSPVHFRESLPSPKKERELLLVQLRLCKGVTKNQVDEAGLTDKIANFLKEGFLEECDGRIRLTQRGRLVYDAIASELI